ALARPDVTFIIAAEDRPAITYPAQRDNAEGRLARMADVLGADLKENAVTVEGEREGAKLSGIAGLPTFSRANSLSQYLFVNGRPVRDKVLLGAVRGAYADLLHGDRHPVVALFLNLDPREVDVNVHPAKTEVRFRDAGLIRALIVRSLQDALGTGARRSSTTGAARLVSFARPARGAARSYTSWRGSAAPLRAGFAEAAQEAFAHFEP